MTKLGTIKKIDDLRKVWPKEAANFTKWLSEEANLSMLGEAIGISLELEETESSVGSFNVDIFAKEEGTGRKVIIENQLGDTDHTHLGQIITYASGKNAEVIVWVVKRARDEHRQAVEWLNQHTDEKLGFFLVEIQLWQIDDSALAPRFDVVESPNEWTKNLRAAEGLTEVGKLRLAYWSAFADFAANDAAYKSNFSMYKPQPQNWWAIWLRGYNSSHLDLYFSSQKKFISAYIYITDNKELFNKYQEHKDDIENEVGMKLSWIEANKDCRIVAEMKGDASDRDRWEEFFRWQIDMAVKLKGIMKKYEK